MNTANGETFLRTLERIKYPNTDKFDSQSFDWLFENEALVPFLDWFCSCVDSSDVLDEVELKEYQELAASDEVVLKGAVLEDALHGLSNQQEDELSEEALREEVAFMQQSLKLEEQRIEELTMTRDQLNAHRISLSHQLSKLEILENKARQEWNTCEEQCVNLNSQLNSGLSALVCHVDSIMGLFKNMDSDEPRFHFQVGFDKLEQGENLYNEHLKAYIKKQFIEDVRSLAAQKDGYECKLVKLADPGLQLVRGLTDDMYKHHCRELIRLQSCYTWIEEERIAALIQQQTMAVAATTLQKQLNRILQGDFVVSPTQLSLKLVEAQERLSLLQKDYNKLQEVVVPGLIQESTELAATRVLTGDYNIKLRRQDYFISRQQQVINALIAQRARSEWVSMALEIEQKKFSDIHKLLEELKDFLSSSAQQLGSRLDMLKVIESQQLHTTLQPLDPLLLKLFCILNGTGRETKNSALLVTYSDLCGMAERLRNNLETLHISRTSNCARKMEKLSEMETHSQTFQKLLYEGSPCKPLTSCPQIIEYLVKLEMGTKQLEHGVMEVMKDFEAKKRVLKTQPYASLEKELWVLFFNNPAKLESEIGSLVSRVEGEKIKVEK